VSALARLGEWLVEPASAPTFPDQGRISPLTPERDRPVVAVVALAPGCGGTTLARALAAVLARQDHGGAAIVAASDAPAGSRLATRGATRLAARLGLAAHASGRLCFTAQEFHPALARLAPVVFETTAPAPRAQLTILIAPGDGEPALTELAARAHTKPLTIATHTADQARWQDRAFLLLPQSRTSARLAAAGWEPRGAYAAAVARLAEAACAA
jgi:hypothetical protein